MTTYETHMEGDVFVEVVGPNGEDFGCTIWTHPDGTEVILDAFGTYTTIQAKRTKRSNDEQ